MTEDDFDARVRTAARAAVGAIRVPPVPVRPSASVRRVPRWWWVAAAAAVAIALTEASAGGRAAIANVVEHTVRVFSVNPDTGKRLPVSAISMADALATTTFRVLEPKGLPAGARLVSIQRMGDPEMGRPIVVFQYDVHGRPFEITETGLKTPGAASDRVVGSSSPEPAPRDAAVRIAAPYGVLFRAGRTNVLLTSESLSSAQVRAIRDAMTRM